MTTLGKKSARRIFGVIAIIGRLYFKSSVANASPELP
jgi:hypothetical protein